MGQSMRSVGGGKHGNQKGAGNQMKNQPEREPGQKVRDQGGEKNKAGKPAGGADHGSRSVR